MSILAGMTVQTFRGTVRLWPSAASLAADLGVSIEAVWKWTQRDSIPSDQWTALIAAAAARGIEGVSAEALAAAASRKQQA